MDEFENTTLDAQPEAQTNVGAADGNGAVSQPSLTLEEINTILGKDFKDKETALKSLKDTQSYVGKRKEDIAKEVGGDTAELSNQIKQMREDLFYKDNPQFAEHRALISKLGENPAEAVNTPEFKILFEKADGFTKSQNLKSVLVSNPRLASSKNNLDKATEALQTGNQSEAESLATKAVLDLLEL